MNQANKFTRQQKMIQWCQDLMGRDDWLIVDTETTGVRSNAEVVQLGIVNHLGQPVLDQLIKPLSPIPADLTEIHGITNEAVASSPTFPELHPQLQKIFEGKTIIAYNASFDSRILAQSCKLNGLPVFENKWDCAMLQYAQYHGDWNDWHSNFRWQKLETAVKSVGITDDFEYHGALADCLATWAVIERVANG